MAKKGIGGVISGSIILFLGAIIITAGVGGRAMANSFLIEPMVGSTLQDIEDQALPQLIPAIQDMAYPEYLETVYTEMQYAFGGDPANLAAFINSSTSMQLVGQVIGNLAAAVPTYFSNPALATWGIFNDTIQAFYGTPIKGVTEFMGIPLVYLQIHTINLTQGTTAGLPGILVPDVGGGTPGMLAFLSVYADPTSAGIPDLLTLSMAYGLPSQNHLDFVAAWIMGELFPLVAGLITTSLGWNELLPDATSATVGDYILAQWAEKALIPAGLESIGGAAVANFEVDSVFENLTQVKNTWNSLVGGSFLRWYAQDTDLTSDFNLTTVIFDDVIAWLPVVLPTVLAGVAGEYGLTYTTPDDLYLRLFVGQWMRIGYLLDDPLFSMLGSPLVFEIDFAPVNVLSSDDGLALWADLKSPEGIKEWFAAVNDRYGPEYEAKAEEFDLNYEQMKDITNYLQEWRDTTLFALNMQEEEIVLPIWGPDLATALDDLELYLPIAGGVFACAGVLLIDRKSVV